MHENRKANFVYPILASMTYGVSLLEESTKHPAENMFFNEKGKDSFQEGRFNHEQREPNEEGHMVA
jgi:hypothetical protein